MILTDLEIAFVTNVGVLRHIQSLGAPHAHGFNGCECEGWGMHIEGAAAEYVVAKARGVFWNPVVRADEFKYLPGDVGDVQVRSTHGNGGHLILHPDDDPDAMFVLVVGTIPRFRIAGWIRGLEGQVPDYWREKSDVPPKVRHPAYFVPQSALMRVAP